MGQFDQTRVPSHASPCEITPETVRMQHVPGKRVVVIGVAALIDHVEERSLRGGGDHLDAVSCTTRHILCPGHIHAEYKACRTDLDGEQVTALLRARPVEPCRIRLRGQRHGDEADEQGADHGGARCGRSDATRYTRSEEYGSIVH